MDSEKTAKKHPHIPGWKVWMLVITVAQASMTAQNCWYHHRCAQGRQLLWDSMERQDQIAKEQAQIVKEHIDNVNQYLKELNQILEDVGK